ncbi:MAG: hypothetical protein ACI9R3_004182 [Verrucomicrobiales bacterium]|jgi:hypothetical protein
MRDYPDDSSTPKWVVELEKIDDAYYEDPDGMGERLDAFARERGLVEPFEKPEAEADADQLASAVDSKAEGKEKIKPESKECPQ